MSNDTGLNHMDTGSRQLGDTVDPQRVREVEAQLDSISSLAELLAKGYTITEIYAARDGESDEPLDPSQDTK